MTFHIHFIDSGREPQCEPDPKYPEGIDVDVRPPQKRTALHRHCCRNLPYPAPRCGTYVVTCESCGYRVAVTVAGRADDPRSITLPCKEN